MNSAAARADYERLTRAAPTTPCRDCGGDALPFTSLCRRCYRALRPETPRLCVDCGHPVRYAGGQSCNVCACRR